MINECVVVIIKDTNIYCQMGDPEYEKEYLARKKKLRVLHDKLKDTKHIQEIYHKIMGSSEQTPENGEEAEVLGDD